MVTTAVEMGLLTLDEFIRRFDEEGPFEILEGEIAPKMPNVARHTLTMHKRLFEKPVFTQPHPGNLTVSCPSPI
ncbi:MAG: hypothetical protein L6Q98_23675, partial [Anaerolineae bacterium]|nr:hypothetical protein [Anaerolineae bacterium]